MNNKQTFDRLFCEPIDGTKERFEFVKNKRSWVQEVFSRAKEDERSK